MPNSGLQSVPKINIYQINHLLFLFLERGEQLPDNQPREEEKPPKTQHFGPSVVLHHMQVKKFVRFCEEVHSIHYGELSFSCRTSEKNC